VHEIQASFKDLRDALVNEQPTPSPKGSGPSLWGPIPAANFVAIILTFAVSVFTAFGTYRTQMLVQSSSHAESLTKAFDANLVRIQNLLSMKNGYKRSDEQTEDMALTALYNFAQTEDDRRTMLTIAAHMLNASACSSAGEPTARFLAVIVGHMKEENSAEDRRLLKFIRGRTYLDLASSDITTSYFEDDRLRISNECGPEGTPPSTLASRPTPTPALPRMSTPDPFETPDPLDPHNYATLWGEQAIWKTAKVDLFRQLRPDNYTGWIHIATEEVSDACAGAKHNHNSKAQMSCTPIDVCYASTDFCGITDSRNVPVSFRLTRARYIRDAPPKVFMNTENIPPFQESASLGHVIGVVDTGECVKPVAAPRHYLVSSLHRRLLHEWLLVRETDEYHCD
jgi:hypothetical protein